MTTKSKDPNTKISISDAADMIDDFGKGNTKRIAKDRKQKRIDYAIKTGALRSTNGQLLLGEFVGWAQNKWKGQLIDYPAVYFGKVAPATSQTCIKVLPHNPQTLDEAMQIIWRLQEENDSLRPDAEKRRNWNSNKGKKRKV